MYDQVNQLEKDKDVVAQAQAIATLEALPECSFAIVNALHNFLCDSKVNYLYISILHMITIVRFIAIKQFVCFLKAFWRVRSEAAFALATTASEVLKLSP